MNKTQPGPKNTTAVILHFRGLEDTLACLRALLAMPDRPGRIVVVDNGSGDGSAQALRLWMASEQASVKEAPGQPEATVCSLLELADNQGYAAGNNAGIRLALDDPCCQAVWILNNDTEPLPGALAALCRCLGEAPGPDMAGSSLVYVHLPERLQCAGGFSLNRLLGLTAPVLGEETLRAALRRDPRAVSQQLDYISGASLLIRREALESIGLLAEEYFLYYEDAEFGVRARKNGLILAWAPDSVVRHKEGGSSGAATAVEGRAFHRPELVDYLSLRNRMHLMRTHFPLAAPVAAAGYAGVILKRVLRGQAGRIPLVLKALWHGLTGRVGKPRVPDAGNTVREPAPSPAVLFLTARADFGGGPEHLRQLLEHRPAGPRACVACPPDYPYHDRFCALVGADNMIGLPHRRFSPRALWRLRAFCRRRDIRVLHSHGKGAGLYARLLSLLTGLPCVHTFHGVHMDAYGPVKQRLYRLYERCMSQFTRVGIAVSPGERQRILKERLMPETRLLLVPNGVVAPPDDTSVISDECRTDPGAVISISRFDYQKNSVFLIDVLRQLRGLGRLEGFHVTLIGDGPDKQTLVCLARRHNLEQAVWCIGSHPEPQTFFPSALCYFSSSRWEGMPLAVLEAMAYGLPVVASDVVGNRDAVTDGVTGLLYPEGDAAAAAAAICRLADDRAVRNMLGSQARAHVIRKHDVRHMAARTWNILLQEGEAG